MTKVLYSHFYNDFTYYYMIQIIILTCFGKVQTYSDKLKKLRIRLEKAIGFM
jgi:hypothetical protein